MNISKNQAANASKPISFISLVFFFSFFPFCFDKLSLSHMCYHGYCLKRFSIHLFIY